MTSYTPNHNFGKKSSGEEKFDDTIHLGGNWDKADAALADTAAQLGEIDGRIDNIVTTPVPVGEIIAEEIIDARDGEVSVGAKVRKIENKIADITHHIQPTGTSDDTQMIITALQTYTNITFKPGVYNIDASIALVIPSNRILNFDQGAILKCIPNALGSYSIIKIDNVSNVVINNVHIIGDRNEHLGTTGEYGFGIYLVNNPQNIKIIEPLVVDCWGDGIYVSSATNMEIVKPITDNCRRNGITIISIDGGRIIKPECRYMNGADPETGIDLEPNLSHEHIKNLLIENPYLHHNNGGGLYLLGKTMDMAQWQNVVINNITAQYNESGVRLETCGDITINTGDLSENTGYGIEVARNIRSANFSKLNIFKNGKRGIGAALTVQQVISRDWLFDSCKIYNNGQLTPGTYDGMRFDSDSDTFPMENVKFVNSLVYDNQDVKTQRYGFTLGAEARVKNFNFSGEVQSGVTGKYLVNNRSHVENGKIKVSKSIDIPNIPANSRIFVDIAQDGVVSGSTVIAHPESDLENGVMWNAIARTNSIRLFVANVTVNAIDPGLRTWHFNVFNI